MSATSPFAGTYQTYTLKGNREDLTDLIFDVSPTETPVVKNAGRGKASALLHEWQTDVLAAAVTTNSAPEGFDITTFSTVTPTVRVGNRLIISMKDVAVSGSAEAIKKAGRKSDLQRELVKRGKELKRDMEKMVTSATLPTSAGSSGNARAFASLLHWVKTNVDKATDGTNPAWTEGVPGFSRTDGTQRAFSETILKAVVQLGYTNGADFSMIVVGPVNKQRVSGFTGIAEIRHNVNSAKVAAIVGAADIYVSDFGNLAIVPDRFSRERDAWFLDPEMLEIAYLRSLQTEKLAKTGDAEKRMLLAEWTLIVKNELGLGLAADLTTT
jgi:hypothetical protein